jgi:hypothetical protein
MKIDNGCGDWSIFQINNINILTKNCIDILKEIGITMSNLGYTISLLMEKSASLISLHKGILQTV